MTLPELKQVAKNRTIETLLIIAEECFDDNGLLPDKNQIYYEKFCRRLQALNKGLHRLDNI